MTEKFNLIKILQQKRKDDKLIFEGAILAFKLPNGETGTWTICNDAGVRLRLLQECKIQEKIMDLVMDDMARKTFMSPSSKDEKRSSMFG